MLTCHQDLWLHLLLHGGVGGRAGDDSSGWMPCELSVLHVNMEGYAMACASVEGGSIRNLRVMAWQ